jgi:methionyl-tRNA formyltransferase
LSLIQQLLKENSNYGHKIHLACSPSCKDENILKGLKPLDLKTESSKLTAQYDFILSAHCRQIFSDALLKDIRCINLHPGYIPFNRGIYPHIFSILNEKPAGVTLHEMTPELDWGPIVERKEVKIQDWDTSLSLYSRILKVENQILIENLEKCFSGNYKTFLPESKGNVNTKADFNKLCAIDPSKNSGAELMRLMRALSHEPHKNAFVLNSNHEKIYLNLTLQSESGHDD